VELSTRPIDSQKLVKHRSKAATLIAFIKTWRGGFVFPTASRYLTKQSSPKSKRTFDDLTECSRTHHGPNLRAGESPYPVMSDLDGPDCKRSQLLPTARCTRRASEHLDVILRDCAFIDLLHEQKSTGCAKLSHAYSSALGGSVLRFASDQEARAGACVSTFSRTYVNLPFRRVMAKTQ
jgi:hypothetical protein